MTPVRYDVAEYGSEHVSAVESKVDVEAECSPVYRMKSLAAGAEQPAYSNPTSRCAPTNVTSVNVVSW